MCFRPITLPKYEVRNVISSEKGGNIPQIPAWRASADLHLRQDMGISGIMILSILSGGIR